MAQTDTRPGFKLPWTVERPESEQPTDETESAQQTAESAVVGESPHSEEPEAPAMIDATVAANPGVRRPTKFMVDLSHAMQVAAESSRDETMTRLGADAKTAIEEIRAGSADESAGLRRRADDDVASVREWSKGEIARIREAAETRIAARKQALDGEMDAYAAVIEARVERVTATVAEFETEMSEFFERLLVEQDPTRIATMAEAMPEPPDLASVAASIAEPVVEPFDPAPVVEATEPLDPRLAALSGLSASEADAAQAASEPELSADGSTETSVSGAPDFAAAEAEASAFSGDLDDDDGLATLAGEHAVASAAAAAAAAGRIESSPGGERLTTKVIVLGLVSVASIATFKRSLGRVPGVSAIGVASGPDGEFVFTVSHDSNLGLAAEIAVLPGFDARVTAESADGLEVTAHDPDAGH